MFSVQVLAILQLTKSVRFQIQLLWLQTMLWFQEPFTVEETMVILPLMVNLMYTYWVARLEMFSAVPISVQVRQLMFL